MSSVSISVHCDEESPTIGTVDTYSHKGSSGYVSVCSGSITIYLHSVTPEMLRYLARDLGYAADKLENKLESVSNPVQPPF
jgi:hypothetical protein